MSIACRRSLFGRVRSQRSIRRQQDGGECLLALAVSHAKKLDAWRLFDR